MTDDLLAKEKEFRRLNKELEEKTRSLFQEVDTVISRQPNYANYQDSETKKETTCCPRPRHPKILASANATKLSIQQTGSTSINDTVKKEETPANKAVANFLKAKIDVLQNELEITRTEYKKKTDRCKELELEAKKFDEQRHKFENQVETLKETITKLENSNSDLRTESQTLAGENSSLKKSVEELRKQIKQLEQQSSNYELRLNRSTEENEKLRSTVKCFNVEEKELRNQVRKLDEEKRLAIKKFEKQRTELIQSFKRQTLLVENLKKQNACLAANGRIQLTEEEFAKILDRRTAI